MSLRFDIVAAARANPDGDPSDIAESLFGTLDKPTLLALIAHEIAVEQRGITRDVEHEAYREVVRIDRSPNAVARPTTGGIEAFRLLFGKSFNLGDGTRVRWERATTAEHELRIVMLEKIRRGIDQTIDLHRAAVDRIEAAAVSCLADLDSDASAA